MVSKSDAPDLSIGANTALARALAEESEGAVR